jgi:hypothetical protein
MKTTLGIALGILVCAGIAPAQKSPAATATATIGGKTVTIKYAAPSVRDRKIFGDGGLISHDANYPIWRAGANSATALHTETALNLGGLTVPAGDYTIFVDVKDPDQWTLIVSKKTGEWGLSYPGASEDLGRVPMKMSKPASLVEVLKYDLSGGKLTLSWENHVASVDLKAK